MSQDLKDKAITYLRHLENRERADARAMCPEKATVWHNAVYFRFEDGLSTRIEEYASLPSSGAA